jgi:hypothetical protein
MTASGRFFHSDDQTTVLGGGGRQHLRRYFVVQEYQPRALRIAVGISECQEDDVRRSRLVPLTAPDLVHGMSTLSRART